MNTEPVSHFVKTSDGLSIHVAEFGPQDAGTPPVVCLPGLTRTAADFDVIARTLAAHGRRALAIDSRGRGLSSYDPNAANYSLPVELADLQTVLAVRQAEPAIFIGSSRGGLLTMLLGAVSPEKILGAVLNDIGPVIGLQGLLRIKGYVGKAAMPDNFEEGAQALRRLFAAQFPALTDTQWRAWARRAWHDEAGKLVPTYDAAIAATLEGVTPETPLPTIWPQFDALREIPLMVVRGANSDILLPETVAEMAARRDRMEIVNVAGEGHTPLLEDAPTVGRIAGFVASCGPDISPR